jgi:hypothetical protein
VTSAVLLACALLAAMPASLVPPGWLSKRKPADSARIVMPSALVGANSRSGPLAQRFPTRVTVSPSPARVGQRLAYRASIHVEQGFRVRFDRPQPGGEFSWGEPRTGRTSVPAPRGWAPAHGGVDSAWMEVPLQVFAPGAVSIPGPALEIVPTPGRGSRMVRRLPTAHLVVLPTVTAADSNARLRALHGPLSAPWWERVPWPLVAAGAVVVAALAALIALLRRRKPAVPAPVAARPQPVRDPGTEALAELAKLRALQLPEAGRFADHAFALSRILHRYLEAVVGTPRPGDTSGELVARLRQSKLAGEDVNRLEGLLGLWDRVKFARAPLGIEEAVRCEAAVESLVRREMRGAA